MNKKLVRGSLAGVAALALAAGGTTMAAWSDFTDITGNNVGSGILKLTVDQNRGSDFTFNQVKMAPGGINMERNVYVASNDGDSTPSGRLFISLKDLVGHEDGCDGNAEAIDDHGACNDTSSQGQFIDDAVMQLSSYAVNSPGDCTQGYAPAGKVVTAMHGGSLRKLAADGRYELTGNGTSLGGVDRSYLAPGEGLCVSMSLSLAYAANNASQGDDASFTTHFDLVQADYGTSTKAHTS